MGWSFNVPETRPERLCCLFLPIIIKSVYVYSIPSLQGQRNAIALICIKINYNIYDPVNVWYFHSAGNCTCQ